MKLKLSAVKLGNADVKFISLVERGANRSPFKIQKQEHRMINLSLKNVFKGRQTSTEPSLVGVVIAKEDRVAEVEQALKAAGVKLDDVMDQGDVLVFKQDDTDPEDEKNVVVKLDTDFMVVCKGFDASIVYYANGLSFGEIIRSQGFLPGVTMASDALNLALRNVLANSSSVDEAVEKADDVVEEFHAYVIELVKNIPQAVFKAFEAFRSAKAEHEKHKEKLKKPDDMSQEDWDNMDDAARRAVLEGMKKVEKGKPTNEAAEKSEDSTVSQKEEAPEEGKAMFDPTLIADAVSSAVKDATAALVKQVGEIAATVQGLTAKIEVVETEAAAAKELAAKTEKSVKGTVIIGGDAGDDAEKMVAQKGAGEIGCFDTAFRHDIRKGDKARYQRRTM